MSKKDDNTYSEFRKNKKEKKSNIRNARLNNNKYQNYNEDISYIKELPSGDFDKNEKNIIHNNSNDSTNSTKSNDSTKSNNNLLFEKNINEENKQNSNEKNKNNILNETYELNEEDEYEEFSADYFEPKIYIK
jgi:hypothetical protein